MTIYSICCYGRVSTEIVLFCWNIRLSNLPWNLFSFVKMYLKLRQFLLITIQSWLVLKKCHLYFRWIVCAAFNASLFCVIITINRVVAVSTSLSFANVVSSPTIFLNSFHFINLSLKEFALYCSQTIKLWYLHEYQLIIVKNISEYRATVQMQVNINQEMLI